MGYKLRQLRPVKRRPMTIGLTGSLASGKSTALSVFKNLGWKTLSADELVAEIYRKEGLRKSDLLKRFGRSRFGMKRLEKWIHPLVKKKIMEFLKATEKSAVVEVPLLFEAQFEKYFDLSAFVFAPFKERVQRALKRGMSLELFKFLEGLQFSSSNKSKRADMVLKNLSKGSLKKQVKKVSELLLVAPRK